MPFRFFYALLLLLVFACTGYAQNFEKVTEFNSLANVQELTVFKDKLFFVADDGVHGREIWSTEGDWQSCKLLKDIDPSVSTWGPQRDLYVSGDKLFFTYKNNISQLWVTDGTSAGTQKLVEFPENVQGRTTYNGKFYFVAQGRQLWVSDGTVAGTKLVKQFPGYSLMQTAVNLTVYKGMLYMNGTDTADRNDLWVSDGTEQGTVLFKAFGNGNVVGKSFYEYNGLLYFELAKVNGSITTAVEPWVTDGTIAGTYNVRNNMVPASTFSLQYLSFNGMLHFIGYDYWGKYTLWNTDATQAGTQLLDTFRGLSRFHVFNDKLYMNIPDANGNRGLYLSDGAVGGTAMLGTFNTIASFDPHAFANFDGHMYFVGNSNIPGVGNRYELWRSDGTVQGTKPLNYYDDKYHFSMQNTNQLVEYKGAFYFNAIYDGQGYQLWKLSLDFPTTIQSTHSENKPFSIYPNPATGTVTMKANSSISCHDQLGQLQFKRIIDGEETIDISGLPAGIYFISDDKGRTEKFTKL